jgi:hypothetical protein
MLFLSVFLGVNLSSFFRVVSCVSGVARGRMGVMGRLLMMASFVVLGSFTVMAGCVGMMLRSLLVMLRRFFGLVAPAKRAGPDTEGQAHQQTLARP